MHQTGLRGLEGHSASSLSAPQPGKEIRGKGEERESSIVLQRET